MPSAQSVKRAGVLALQGGFAAHVRALERVGCEAVEVRRTRDLDSVDGLVIPGGESTTLLKFMEYEPEWWDALLDVQASGRPMLGTCAGLILLAKTVTDPAQRSLGCLDVSVVRNGYGRQKDSFIDDGLTADGQSLELVFIRAPRIQSIGEGVEVLVTYQDEPVMVRHGTVFGATFHPELASETRVHEMFVRGLSCPDFPSVEPR